MTFWPVCIGSTGCDGWTVAGLAATILGIAAAFLSILGAMLLASWWTQLDKRVERQVATLFHTRLQPLQARMDQVSIQATLLQSRIDTLELRLPEQEEKARQITNKLAGLASRVAQAQSTAESAALEVELAHKNGSRPFSTAPVTAS
ncbi:MAG TPA: hypothetical protein VFU49_00145 [Ktedonobacteraceae bacterium]|nr:hypothetical protein [Ktedonobacteraceae bacterium]